VSAAATAQQRAEGAAGASPPAPVLEIEDLSITYRSRAGDVNALRHVDLALRPGEVVGLAGESGSGKSTLALGAVRLLRPPAVITSGRVTYRGRRIGEGGFDVLAASAEELRRLRWREISIVFQSAMNALNPVLRIRDQLGDVIDTHMPLRREAKRARLESLLDLVGIPRERLRSYPHELSGGMRQRVMIAMALAVEPEVVIMDEPTTALDVVVQREILEEIAQLRQELGFAMLFITHDLSLLLELADRIMILYAGQLAELGSALAIRNATAHPYTAGLLDSFPSVRGPRRALSGIPGSPPDMRELPRGCPFTPRCGFARADCSEVSMKPLAVGEAHVSTCPFVGADELARARAARREGGAR
jgi:peptide/nickel transport system ATP-binding protein